MTSVAGYCPLGCGRSLVLGEGGHVTCSADACPEPDAAATLLEDLETEHLIKFGEDGFTIRHPLRERLRDELMTCDLHSHCLGSAGPPVKPGRYRAVRGPGGWAFQPHPAPE